MRVMQSTVLVGRYICEGIRRLESWNPSQTSLGARPIQTRSMIGPGANGHECYGTRPNSNPWMSRCVILSWTGAASTNVRRGSPDVLGDADMRVLRYSLVPIWMWTALSLTPSTAWATFARFSAVSASDNAAIALPHSDNRLLAIRTWTPPLRTIRAIGGFPSALNCNPWSSEDGFHTHDHAIDSQPMHPHSAFDRYRESCPRRSELHQNRNSRDGDEQSAVPAAV